MNKYILVSLLILIIFGVGGYFFLSQRNLASNNTSMQVSPTIGNEQSLSKGSLKDLFSAGVSQTCTFTSKMGDYQSDGVVYVTSGKMRGDFNSLLEGKTISSHMIVEDNTSYMWADGQTQGVKVAFGDEEKAEAEKSLNQAELDVNADLDYKCKPGEPDSTLFTLPSEVQFVSLSEMMQNIPTGSTSQCDSCNSLPEATKAQCLAALKCN